MTPSALFSRRFFCSPGCCLRFCLRFCATHPLAADLERGLFDVEDDRVAGLEHDADLITVAHRQQRHAAIGGKQLTTPAKGEAERQKILLAHSPPPMSASTSALR